ncbi:MAG: NYN domain-containing protein [Candidatus Omnitrophica bacterium]|nr:NYN domain-containing protein [Candidatus Omnitrophota bacterium]MCF7877650.1 NYN domain-containing protein [Candidatus Omnitrophota bacterium]MCF7892291.1 NYN domain-containing protein [Candidatus Omnitrophota bacterium]MCF7897968.1 NYN domain-containing protein [Candidatus Omnitrophota bacterium]
MLQFIIDGYNLVHKIPEVKGSSTPCSDLLTFIYKNKLTGSNNNEVWVIFDGGQPPYQINNFQYKIRFSSQESADDLIIKKIEGIDNRKQTVVVTDDRQLAYRARFLGARSISVDEFVSKTKKRKKKEETKDIEYSLQREITEELKKIWLDENKS